MSDDADKPIVSTRADDPEVEGRIDAFVFGLGERVDRLQDLEAEAALTALADAAEALASDAEQLGYAPLAAAAGRLAAVCREASPEAARKGVIDLTGLAQRVRLGHRSAA